MPHLFYPLGAKFEAIKHATSTGIMRHCENNLEQGSRIQVIVNDIRNFVFGLAGASVYGSGKSRKQKFVMSFTIRYEINFIIP